MKVIKIAGIALGIVALLAIGIAVAFAVFFDPNSFRGKISAAVKDQTGRELTIAGDIGLRFFPWLGVKISRVTVGNAPGFGPEPFAEIGEAQVSVRLLPLILHREVKAGTVSLDGLKVNLAKDAKGRGNWEDFGEKQKEPGSAAAAPAEKSAAPEFEIGGLEIRNAALSYSDAQNKKSYRIEQLEFTTGTLKPGQPIDLDAKLRLSASDPDITADLKLAGSLEADTQAQRYGVKKFALDVAAQGGAVPGGKQDLKLTGELALDQGKGVMKFSGGKLQVAGLTVTADIDGRNLAGDAPSFTGPVAIAPFSPRTLLKNLKIEIPEPADGKALGEASLDARLSATSSSATLDEVKLKLDQTTATGRLGIRDFASAAIEFALKVDAIDLDRYLAKKAAQAGKSTAADKQSFNATEIPVKALDGINADGTLAIGSLKLSGLQLSDASIRLSAAKGKVKSDDLSAKLYGGSIQSRTEITPGERPRYASTASLAGVQVGPLLKDLMGKDYVSGTGNFSMDINSSGRTVADVRRALGGDISFNLDKGAVKGFNLGLILRRAQALLRGQQLADGGGEAQQTDFADLRGKGRIAAGVLTTEYLTATNPAFRFAGEGTVDIGNEQINYLAKPTVVESTEGAGGKGLDELRGLTVPIRVTGSFDDPKYTIDIQEALKQKAAGRINQELDKQKGRLMDKLGDFLRKQQPPAEQQQAPAPKP